MDNESFERSSISGADDKGRLFEDAGDDDNAETGETEDEVDDMYDFSRSFLLRSLQDRLFKRSREDILFDDRSWGSLVSFHNRNSAEVEFMS